MSDNKKMQPPYPRLGEIFQVLAGALDTKSDSRHRRQLSNQKLDRMAREGEFDWSLMPTLAQELIVDPLEDYVDSGFAGLIGQFIAHVQKEYLNVVKTISLDALSREEALPLLIEHFFAPLALNLVHHTKNLCGGPDLIRLLDPELNPVDVVMTWLDERGGGFFGRA